MSVTACADTDYDPGPSPRLDEGTELVGLRWWPDAGEAVAFIAGGRGQTPEELADRRAEETTLLDPDHPLRVLRREENVARAARRARAKVRRYVVANGLTRMVSLTFRPTVERRSSPGCGQAEVPPSSAEPVHQPGGDGRCTGCGRPLGVDGVAWAMGQAAGFVRRLRGLLGVDALPYVVVPEFHADGHVHLHMLVGRYLEKSVVERAWRLGFVDVGRSRSAPGDGGREQARKAAAYASKYVTKAFEEGVAGRHRYEVAQGFQPAVIKRSGYRSLEAAIRFVEDHEAVTFAVHSDGLDDYEGPPFLWVALETYR